MVFHTLGDMELEVRHLRVLLAVAAAGSVSAAARHLQVAQPALSRQLHRIEAAAGTPLFTRTAAGLAVTEAGARFLDRARGLVDAFDGLSAPAGPPPGVPATIRLATYCLPIGGVLERIAPELGIRAVRCTEVPAQEAVHRLAAGEVDLVALTAWPHAPEPAIPPGLRHLPVVREPMALMLPRTHPLAQVPDPPLDALAGARWVARTDLVTTDAECRRAGFVPDIAYRYDDHGYYLTLVGSGAAVAFCSPTTYVTGQVVVRQYHDPSMLTWALVHDPLRLPAAAADRIGAAVCRRRREVLAAAVRAG